MYIDSMDDLSKVDLTTLSPDVVLEYAKRVISIDDVRKISKEKNQMLLLLCQKLIGWFLIEREEISRANLTLETELLHALRQVDEKSSARNISELSINQENVDSSLTLLQKYEEEEFRTFLRDSGSINNNQTPVAESLSVENETEIHDVVSDSPYEMYRKMHGATINLQRLVRGFLVRKRFIRMLEEMVFSGRDELEI